MRLFLRLYAGMGMPCVGSSDEDEMEDDEDDDDDSDEELPDSPQVSEMAMKSETILLRIACRRKPYQRNWTDGRNRIDSYRTVASFRRTHYLSWFAVGLFLEVRFEVFDFQHS